MTPWILKHPAPAQPRLRLFCFPFAGGGASAFRPWCEIFADDQIEIVPIQPPGRENRFREPAAPSFAPAIEALTPLIGEMTDAPFAFFGHSAGGHLAFEIARELRRTGRSAPVHLFVSARRAVHLPDRAPLMAPLDDETFLQEVIARYGADAPVKDMELYKLMLPVIRADIQATEEYPYQEEAPFEFPITTLGGKQDECATAFELEAWRAHTSAAFALHLFDGAHFYLNSARNEVTDFLRRRLLASLETNAVAHT